MQTSTDRTTAFNPFLPDYEYIPDGEPYIFNGRIYMYGSHDRFNGLIFCLNDYVCWSAPTDDPGNWSYEGVIYRKNQDPKNRSGLRLLFAPDVTRGPDGRFYLYYSLDLSGTVGVAVCDEPAGKYEFLGHLRHADGVLLGRKKGDCFPFDPAVLNDDGRILLYTGFRPRISPLFTGLRKLQNDGPWVTELEPDMLTIRTENKLLLTTEESRSCAGHEFFEASSIRKIGGRYYFVYSSVHNHELCYAVSDFPDREFGFGGTLVSNGDIGMPGVPNENLANNYTGNNHGGLLELNGKLYIFYHRQTNRHSYSRQACAEELFMDEHGHITQAEMTSCGLNGTDLPGTGSYDSRIACLLTSKDGTGRYDKAFARLKFRTHPFFTQDVRDAVPGRTEHYEPLQYIANMRDGAVAGFKYFDFAVQNEICVEIRGRARGRLFVYHRGMEKSPTAVVSVDIHSRKWVQLTTAFAPQAGRQSLYFRFEGQGRLDFRRFTIM